MLEDMRVRNFERTPGCVLLLKRLLATAYRLLLTALGLPPQACTARRENSAAAAGLHTR